MASNMAQNGVQNGSKNGHFWVILGSKFALFDPILTDFGPFWPKSAKNRCFL